ncbi:unnamed protein product [Coffea canephora]|uniref:Uncharacterized protein n=1 Tax=Coffea canephora TaxID=49390 RepID=A0A068V850_COFCA|nr:unnamed protein product [Coffea canephora]
MFDTACRSLENASFRTLFFVQKKEEGLDSIVRQHGLNWSMCQRQLFCLGQALFKRRKILILDEATASIDNATDSIIQKTIRTWINSVRLRNGAWIKGWKGGGV